MKGSLIVGKLDHGKEFLDFRAKYLYSRSPWDEAASISEAKSAEIQAMAEAAFRELDCEGLARVDFYLLPDGRLLVGEVNTMPGLSPPSAFPHAWSETGLPYEDLLDKVIAEALNRPPDFDEEAHQRARQNQDHCPFVGCRVLGRRRVNT